MGRGPHARYPAFFCIGPCEHIRGITGEVKTVGEAMVFPEVKSSFKSRLIVEDVSPLICEGRNYEKKRYRYDSLPPFTSGYSFCLVVVILSRVHDLLCVTLRGPFRTINYPTKSKTPCGTKDIWLISTLDHRDIGP